MVSKNAIVGSVKGAEGTIQRILMVVSKGDMATDTIEFTEIAQNIPSTLVELARQDLMNFMPSESRIKDWFLYDEDFSGITFYTTNDGTLTFASITRGVDLSSGYQYADNRYEAKSYSDAYCSGDQDKIQIAEAALKANLPGKKIKYCHWVGNKPSKHGIEEFQALNPQYFPST
jgi:hypothetical protein